MKKKKIIIIIIMHCCRDPPPPPPLFSVVFLLSLLLFHHIIIFIQKQSGFYYTTTVQCDDGEASWIETIITIPAQHFVVPHYYKLFEITIAFALRRINRIVKLCMLRRFGLQAMDSSVLIR